jgi:hypothetical protein
VREDPHTRKYPFTECMMVAGILVLLMAYKLISWHNAINQTSATLLSTLVDILNIHFSESWCLPVTLLFTLSSLAVSQC